jgi:Flp pilus assembly pilin Flp
MWRRASRQRGQGTVEYAIILTIVSMVVILILLVDGGQIKNVFKNVACGLGESGTCAAAVVSPAPICPTVVAPTLAPEVSATPVYTYGAADFSSHQRVLQGSIVRVLFGCAQSGAAYRSVSGTALVPILWGDGYAVFVAASSGDASIEGSLDNPSDSKSWRIDVTVVAS